LNNTFADTLALLEKKERRHLCYYVLLDVIIIIIDIASLALLLFVINFYTRPEYPTIITSLLPASLTNRSSILLILVILIFFSVKNILAYYLHQSRYQFLYKVASRIAEKNLLQYLEGNYNTYVSVDSAVQIRRISQEPIEFSHYVLAGFVNIISQSILIVLAVIVMLVFNAGLFLLLFIILLPPVFLVAFIVKRKTRAARTHAKKSSENTLQFLKEALAGFVEANIFDKRNFFLQRYAGWQRKLNEHLSNIQSVQAMPNRMIEIFAVAGLFILIVLNNQAANPNNGAALINIGAFMAAAYKIMPAVVLLLNSNSQVKTYAYTVTDLQQIKPVAYNGITTEPIPTIACLSFSNICFQYGSKKILQNFNAAIVKGDFIGIKGNSGVGKTTIIHLLLGFLDPQFR
jgi:ABC-type multidrug transport system fused ATPase/permease subunit